MPPDPLVNGECAILGSLRPKNYAGARIEGLSASRVILSNIRPPYPSLAIPRRLRKQ